jgi:hypothetical protein
VIANTSRELVDSMSDIVWAIDPQRDHLNDLTARHAGISLRRFSGFVRRFNSPFSSIHFSPRRSSVRPLSSINFWINQHRSTGRIGANWCPPLVSRAGAKWAHEKLYSSIVLMRLNHVVANSKVVARKNKSSRWNESLSGQEMRLHEYQASATSASAVTLSIDYALPCSRHDDTCSHACEQEIGLIQFSAQPESLTALDQTDSIFPPDE